MKHTKFIQDSASAYMIAYNQAMQDTHNPNMAAQIASVASADDARYYAFHGGKYERGG